MNQEGIWGESMLSRGNRSLEAGAAGGQCSCGQSTLEGGGQRRSDKQKEPELIRARSPFQGLC